MDSFTIRFSFIRFSRSPKPMVKKKKASDTSDSTTARRIKEKFRSDISDDIVRHLRPYMSSECSVGRIQSKDDFRHLARKVCTKALPACLTFSQKWLSFDSIDIFSFIFSCVQLTYFVMLKELKYCIDVNLLEVTDSVKNKAREYIKKYMSKFGKLYIRDENDKDYDD